MKCLIYLGREGVVDVQSVRQQFVANREILDALPGARSFQGRAAVVPGITTNTLALGTSVLTIHGSASSDAYTYIDGMRSGAHMTATGNTGGGPNLMDSATEEITFDTGAQGAESQVGGVRMNMIPKEGGNRFAGTLFAYGAGAGVQSDNRTSELKATV